MEQFFFWLGNVANILSLITLVVSIMTFLKVQQETRRLRRSFASLPPVSTLEEAIASAEGVQSHNPVALALALTTNADSIKKPVEDFLMGKGYTMPIEELNMNGLSPKTIGSFQEAVRNKKRELNFHGYTEVHLFINGPVQAGTIIGCLFSNWIPVKLYHLRQGGSYEYWTLLTKQ